MFEEDINQVLDGRNHDFNFNIVDIAVFEVFHLISNCFSFQLRRYT
jgi:hypothetical protein